MRKKLWLLLLLCLLLTACNQAAQPDTLPAENPAPPAAAPIPPAGWEIDEPSDPEPVFLDRLTIEVVVDWSEADRILSRLEELSQLVGEALEEKECTVENPVTVTIGTAGGVTAQALAGGGVDAAILPTGDYAEIEEKASAVFHSMDDGIMAVVTLAREELDENFRTLLSSALLETDAGKEFLEICYPGVVFIGMNERVSYFAEP